MVKHIRPVVEERPLDGGADAARLGITTDKLSLLMKLMATAMDKGSPHEAARATRLMKRKLAELKVSSEDADAVLRPSSDAELLRQGGIFEVHLILLRLPSWLEQLGSCMCELLGVEMFWRRGDKEVILGFYGEHGVACTAAQLFADVYVSVWRMSDAYQPAGEAAGVTLRQSRADYRHAMVGGYTRLCQAVTKLRAEAARAVAAGAEAKQAAAAAAEEVAAKKRLRAEAARAVMADDGLSDSEEEGGSGWVPPSMAAAVSSQAPAPVVGGGGCDDDSEDDVQILEVVSAEEVRKRKLAAAFGPGGSGVVVSDDEEEPAGAQLLALVEKRNDRIVAIVSGKLGLVKARKMAAHAVVDQRAWLDGDRDSRQLPTGRAVEGA